MPVLRYTAYSTQAVRELADKLIETAKLLSPDSMPLTGLLTGALTR